MNYVIATMKSINDLTDDIYEALADSEMDDAKVAIGKLSSLLNDINETISIEDVTNRIG